MIKKSIPVDCTIAVFYVYWTNYNNHNLSPTVQDQLRIVWW